MQTKTKFILAPMYEVTDTVFRRLISELSPPDVFYTEFVNVDGLQSKGRDAVISKLKFTRKEKPIIAQIWGSKPDNFYKTSQEIVKMGFAGIDINMGCPDKNVTKAGLCSALINNRELAKEIIDATKRGAGKLPVSVKTRLGYNSVDYSWHEFLLNQGIDTLIVHARTKKQMSKVPADYEAMKEIVKLRNKISPNTKIVGNGDVFSKQQGIELAKKYKLDGIMIGRGIFKDPFVFSDNSPWEKLSKKQRVKIFKRHAKLWKKTYGDSKPVYILNKFCKIYINNFDGAKELRDDLMKASSIDELISKLKQI